MQYPCAIQPMPAERIGRWSNWQISNYSSSTVVYGYFHDGAFLALRDPLIDQILVLDSVDVTATAMKRARRRISSNRHLE